jgi:uncharacterized damage-inducible protein DinB
MTIETFHQLYLYNWWANCRLLDTIQVLSSAELGRDLGGSFPSVHKTLLHIHWVDMLFLRRWRGLSTEDLAAPPVLKTIEEIRASWERVRKEQVQFLEHVKDADLNKILSYIDSRGRSISIPLQQVMLHLVNHSTYHRGQLASQLRQLGKVPPPTDFILFSRENK